MLKCLRIQTYPQLWLNRVEKLKRPRGYPEPIREDDHRHRRGQKRRDRLPGHRRQRTRRAHAQ